MLNLSSRKKVQDYHRTHRHTWIVKNLALFAILSQTKHTQKHRTKTPKFTLKIVSQPVLEVRCQCLSYVSFLRLCQMVYSIILYGVSFLSHKYRMLAYVYCHLPSSKCWRLFFLPKRLFFSCVRVFVFFSLLISFAWDHVLSHSSMLKYLFVHKKKPTMQTNDCAQTKCERKRRELM